MLNEETFINTESDVMVKKQPLQTANNVCMNIQCVVQQLQLDWGPLKMVLLNTKMCRSKN